MAVKQANFTWAAKVLAFIFVTTFAMTAASDNGQGFEDAHIECSKSASNVTRSYEAEINFAVKHFAKRKGPKPRCCLTGNQGDVAMARDICCSKLIHEDIAINDTFIIASCGPCGACFHCLKLAFDLQRMVEICDRAKPADLKQEDFVAEGTVDQLKKRGFVLPGLLKFPIKNFIKVSSRRRHMLQDTGLLDGDEPRSGLLDIDLVDTLDMFLQDLQGDVGLVVLLVPCSSQITENCALEV